MIRRGVALLLALAFVTPPAQASDLARPVLKLELGISLRDSGKLDFSLNGIPMRQTERADMTCPPPPQSCAGMIAVMSVAVAASVVLLYALSRDR